jgi:hypothetical protein
MTLSNVENISDLHVGMDFRKAEYRREVFLRFYEFHTKYKAHPGAVYYTMPYLFEAFNLNTEQKYWLCFLNGVCQNIITTWEIFNRFPEVPKDKNRLDELSIFFRANYKKFGWDTDRRYVKNQFEKCVEKYMELLAGGTQEEYFDAYCNENATVNFDNLWNVVMSQFYLFGRLSTFSYLEYLKIAGLNIECSTLFLFDLDGSKSHRNGLCKVLGRDDLDWHSSNPAFNGYEKTHLKALEYEGEILLQEAKARGIDASYFTLESTLCCYKSWYRKNRRYPNVYNDMFYERILRNEREWGRKNFLFREIRQSCLPPHLLIEENYRDPGLKPEKQNWFRDTGEVIMMDKEWHCFKNGFNDTYYGII